MYTLRRTRIMPKQLMTEGDLLCVWRVYETHKLSTMLWKTIALAALSLTPTPTAVSSFVSRPTFFVRSTSSLRMSSLPSLDPSETALVFIEYQNE
jgi:hypothetical protein